MLATCKISSKQQGKATCYVSLQFNNYLVGLKILRCSLLLVNVILGYIWPWLFFNITTCSFILMTNAMAITLSDPHIASNTDTAIFVYRPPASLLNLMTLSTELPPTRHCTHIIICHRPRYVYVLCLKEYVFCFVMVMKHCCTTLT